MTATLLVDRALLEQALEAFRFLLPTSFSNEVMRDEAIKELRAALDATEVESVAWHPTEAAITALKRFEETCTDNEGYDVPKDTMRNLQAIGLIYRTYGDMYCITDYGHHILAAQEPKQ